jgi:hypothetical protein
MWLYEPADATMAFRFELEAERLAATGGGSRGSGDGVAVS